MPIAVQLPTSFQLFEIAGELGLDLGDADVESFLSLLAPSIAAYNIAGVILPCTGLCG